MEYRHGVPSFGPARPRQLSILAVSRTSSGETTINTPTEHSPEDWRGKFDAPHAPDTELPGVGQIRHLRVWPAVVCLVGLWLTRLVPPLLGSDNPMIFMVAIMGPLVFTLLILIWWLFFSCASVLERWLGLLGLILVGVVNTLLEHKSVRGFGTMMMAIPWGITAYVVALFLMRSGFNRHRVAFALVAAFCGFGFWDSGAHGYDLCRLSSQSQLAVDAHGRRSPAGRTRRSTAVRRHDGWCRGTPRRTCMVRIPRSPSRRSSAGYRVG